MKLSLKSVLIAGLLAFSVSFAFAQQSPPSGAPETELGHPEAASQPKVSMSKVKILLDKAKEALLQGDDTQAGKYLGQVVEIARQAWEMDDVTTSEGVFRQVLILKPDNAEALFGLAELYRRTNPIMAVEYYTRYIQSHPSDPAAYYGRGSCYLAREAYSLAIQDLETLVTRLEPNNVGGLTNLALAYRGRAMEKNYDPDLFKTAVKYMKDAVAAAEVSSNEETKKLIPELKYRLGRMVFEYQQILARAQIGDVDFSEAIEYLQQAIQAAFDVSRRNVDDLQALNQMILCYDALSEIFNAQAQLNPKDPTPYLNLAQTANRRSMIIVRQSSILALNYLKKAVEVDPKIARNWAILADTYAQLGDLGEAIKAIDKALTLEPENKDFKALKQKMTAATQPADQKKPPMAK